MRGWIASLRMNNQAAVYINDEKNAGEPTNLSVPIPAIPLIPKRHQPGITAGARENRTFSDVLLILHTTLDPKVFPTIEDRPRHQQYYFESENTEAMAQKINGNLKKSIPLSKIIMHRSFTLMSILRRVGIIAQRVLRTQQRARERNTRQPMNPS